MSLNPTFVCIKEAKIPTHDLEETTQPINEVLDILWSPFRYDSNALQDAIMVYEHIPVLHQREAFYHICSQKYTVESMENCLLQLLIGKK